MISGNKILSRRSGTALPVEILIAVAGFLWSAQGPAAATAIPLPDPVVDQQTAGDEPQTAVIAGGCFWGIQAVYQHTKGVQVALSGYSGGMKTNPTYEEVSSGRTGHAEAVQIKYNPREISYGQILKIFFSGRARSDAAQPARTGHRHAISFGDLLFQRRAEENCRGLHRATRPGRHFHLADRHQSRPARRLLSRGKLSSGLCDQTSDAALHRNLRPAES